MGRNIAETKEFARLRHVDGTQWGDKNFMNNKSMEATVEVASIAR